MVLRQLDGGVNMVINGPTLVADAILNRVWPLATRMLDVKLRPAKLDFSWNFGLAYSAR